MHIFFEDYDDCEDCEDYEDYEDYDDYSGVMRFRILCFLVSKNLFQRLSLLQPRGSS